MCVDCRYRVCDECTFEDFDENEDYATCDECPHYAEGDEFIGYVEWVKDQDAKLRYEEGLHGK